MLRKILALAVVAVCTLALGIGVNIALFTVIDAILLRPLPVKDANQVVVLANRDRHFEFPHGLSNLQLQDFRRRTAVFSDLAGVFPYAVNMTVAGQPQRTFVDFTTSSFFSMLGVQAARGRVYTEPEITKPNAAPVMVISDGFWRRSFGADPSVVGKPVTINGETVTVAGILPPTFPGVEIVTIDAYLPVEQAGRGPNREDFLHLRDAHNFKVLGRLKPDVSLTQA